MVEKTKLVKNNKFTQKIIFMLVKPINQQVKEKEIFLILEDCVREWFKKTFKKFTLPQLFGIKLIHEGKNTLITAPTGSGKTLACFLSIINELIRLARENKLEDYVYCIYVSPLRALANDIKKNLLIPLKGIEEIAKKKRINLQEIRVGIRTGDTLASEKQKQLKYPPHILITTPETLAIILSTKKFKEKLKKVRWVILDEIHELANSKRGIHLTISLERLQNYVEKPFVRIGAGATLEPLEEAAKFLVGIENGKPRECYIVDARFVKPIDIKVIVPSNDLLFSSADEINKSLYKTLDELISKHRTTLVFTNTRSGAERVHYHLKQLFPSKYLDEVTGVHHSSISRDIRFDVENRLKEGKLKVVISSTSLELGIDIGYIDLVIQIGSPKSVSRLMQRIGRAGHSLKEISKGRIICLDRDDLIECLVMTKKCYEYWLDRFEMPKNCLDVLAQHLLGMSLEKKWNVNEAYNLIKRAYPFSNLSFETFYRVLEYLAGKYHTLEDYKVYGKIWLDEKNMQFGRKGKYARVIYTLNVGTIPDEVKIKVKTLDGKFVGFIEEGFLERLVKGDIFVLGGKTYEFVKAKKSTCYVLPTKEKRPTIPSWFSEQLPLNYDLALEIAKFREKIMKMIEKKREKEVINYLKKEYLANENVAKNVYNYLKLELEFLRKYGIKNLPSNKTILIENVIENNYQHIIFHTLFGRRINDALSRAYGYALMKKVGKGIGIAINDNGFVLSIPLEEKGWILVKPKPLIDSKKVIKLVNSKNFEDLLKKSLINTELLKRKFRHVATRSLMILRNYKGHEISIEKQQINAEKLIKIVKNLERFPVLEETYREILEDFMDVKNSKKILEDIEKGKIKLEFLPILDVPSPFAHNLFALSESDVVLMEDRKKLLLELHKKIEERLKKG
ncbi:MAG: ATP-dependent helicase [Candidatus Aenigmatarchaeota archaeon]